MQREQVVEPRFEALPGWELVSRGVADLAAGKVTVEALLVAEASERLKSVGIAVPGRPEAIAPDLYDVVIADVGESRAHGRYNALRRRLTSFLRAAASA
jgi:hypothetical protein